ncbi:MAG TPA: carbohydrate binding domain-containing protein [Pyrinomonadaceae bacterium]|nr:carbohydrate binding domain-containing protein [Pyrinomonadaceae bacterium]
MPQEVAHISVRKLPVKIFLILLLLAAGVWSYYVIRWYLGNTLAEYFDPSSGTLDAAKWAATMAPDDPLAHWRIAQISQKTLPLDQQIAAIPEYEKAVSLSPNDYRFWMTLGTAQEQVGNDAQSELALKRAVALAPAYAYPRWYLGNLYLRAGRYDEAFAELRLASQADPELMPQLFNLVWEIYSNDPEALKNAVGQNAAARAYFAFYLLGRKRADDGLRLWNDLSSDEKRTNKDTGDKMVKHLITELRYHDALQVWNDINGEKSRMEIDKIFDGSFEEAVIYAPDTVFGWYVRGAPQMHIGIDPNKGHNGERSLRLVFQVRTNIQDLNASQLIAMQPNKEYAFEYYVATDKLETGSGPQLQIVDANTGEALAISLMAPTGSNDWQRMAFNFKTKDKTQAVMLKVVRFSCSNEDTPICPIFGSVWYDDFNLKRTN